MVESTLGGNEDTGFSMRSKMTAGSNGNTVNKILRDFELLIAYFKRRVLGVGEGASGRAML